MAVVTSLLSEAELHGLVDGHVDADRRPDILHRVASSPRDRERVASWQEQSDLIRDVFRGVENESLPSALNLRPPPHTLVPGNTVSWAARISPSSGDEAAIVIGKRSSKRRIIEMVVTTMVVAAGLAGAWTASTSSARAPAMALRGSLDETLARHAIAALSVKLPSSMAADAAAMPTTSIPDLTSFGFSFSAAEMRAGEPASMIFRYRNGAAEQIAVAVTRAPGEKLHALEARYDAFVWRAGPSAYAIAGSLDRDRLRAVAVSLRNAVLDD